MTTDRFHVHPNGQPWLATPRPGSVLPTVCAPAVDGRSRTGVPRVADASQLHIGRLKHGELARATSEPVSGTPYRQAYPRHAHQFRPDPLPPESRAVRRALIGVLLIVVALAASLVKVS